MASAIALEAQALATARADFGAPMRRATRTFPKAHSPIENATSFGVAVLWLFADVNGREEVSVLMRSICFTPSSSSPSTLEPRQSALTPVLAFKSVSFLRAAGPMKTTRRGSVQPDD